MCVRMIEGKMCRMGGRIEGEGRGVVCVKGVVKGMKCVRKKGISSWGWR